MSIQTTRAKFIRSEMMTAALYGKTEGAIISDCELARFSAIYNFIDFISKGNGYLRAHPITGEDPQDYADRHPQAVAAYRKAVRKWGDFREKVRQEYLNK